MATSSSITLDLPHIPWRTTFPLATWIIWLARNKLVMEGQPFISQLVIDRIKATTQDIFHTLPSMFAHSKSKVIHIGWKPPPFGFHKLNTNGFAKGNPGLASAGNIIKDHKGSWIGSFNRDIGHTHSLATKLWGLRDDLSLARSSNIKKLLIEIDAQALVNIIMSHSVDSSHPYNGLISDCRSILCHFKEACLYHIHCEANHCADILAKEGELNPNSLVSHSNPPCILY